MRLARFAWWLPPLLAIGGFFLINTGAFCTYPIGYYGVDSLERCTMRFLGMDLSANAAGWLAIGIGAALGTALALILIGEAARWTWRGIRRPGLIIVGVASLLLGGIAVYSWLDSPASRTIPKVWTIGPGETLHVPADQVIDGDEWACPGGGRSLTPPPGQTTGNTVYTVKVDVAGNVTLRCERRPPEDG
jgi:hypothetical protein